jgi:hypothetical protein
MNLVDTSFNYERQSVGIACRNQLALTCFMFREMQAKKNPTVDIDYGIEEYKAGQMFCGASPGMLKIANCPKCLYRLSCRSCRSCPSLLKFMGRTEFRFYAFLILIFCD